MTETVFYLLLALVLWLVIYAHHVKLKRARALAREKVLAILSDRQEWTGLALIVHSDGALGKGTGYVYLTLLEQAGEIVSRPHPGYQGQRLYRLPHVNLNEDLV